MCTFTTEEGVCIHTKTNMKLQIRKVGGTWRYRWLNTYTWEIDRPGSSIWNDGIIKGSIFQIIDEGPVYGHQKIMENESKDNLYTTVRYRSSTQEICQGIGYIRRRERSRERSADGSWTIRDMGHGPMVAKASHHTPMERS
jgi:hypothetical protein